MAIDIQPARLERASEFGADKVINPLETDSIQAIRQATNGRGATMALECSGSVFGARDALGCVGTWGTVCFVGLGAEVRFDVRTLLASQITMMSSWSMSIAGQMECADYIVQRGLNFDRLLTDEWTLEQAETAYRHFDKQNAGKGVFVR
jgi:threonine dehydrogenase-like Zn-dependent dehydrogenase